MICSLAAGPRTVITDISICTPSPYAFVYHTVNLCTRTTLKVSSSSLESCPPLAPRRRHRTVRNEDGGVLLKLRIQYNRRLAATTVKIKGPKKGQEATPRTVLLSIYASGKNKTKQVRPHFFLSLEIAFAHCVTWQANHVIQILSTFDQIPGSVHHPSLKVSDDSRQADLLRRSGAG